MPGPPPGPRATSTTQTSKTTRSSGLSLDEIINDQEAEIKDAATARTFLDQLYTIQGEPATPEHISHALFYISQSKGVNNTLRSAIRATAYLVRELATSELAESITTAVSGKIEKSVVAAISPQIANILSAAENLEKTNKNMKSTNDDTIKKLELIASTPDRAATTQLEDHVKNLIEDMNTVKTALEDVKNHIKVQPPAFPTPYKDALASTPANPNHIPLGKRLAPEYAKAHAAIKERQLLIDPNSDHPLLNNSATRESTIDLIKQALETIDRVDGPSMQLKSIARLCSNGILLEFNNQEAVAWIKEPANKMTFLAKLGGDVAIKDRHYNIVIPFLPITTETDNQDMLRDMENENNIPQGSIARIKWIKDPAKRTPNQRVAHALASITSPEVANQLLKDGLYWGLDRLCLHKDKKEPVRCLKCQCIGHLARDCNETTDTCGICAQPHHRNCPDLIKRRNAMDERMPENRMPYFPTSEEWTHVELPTCSTNPIVPTRPPTIPPANNGPLRQITLGEAMNLRSGPPRHGLPNRTRGGRGGPPICHNILYNTAPTHTPIPLPTCPTPETISQPEDLNPTPPLINV
ncbi:hypothetical protein M404DRAFT_170381 [Pisolithus tinctorius Marx 270]|uniref:CCHC-type domain-containing protein n=1 Tax=Pisolithus tinctorius Marx 270 TaxID=870435 RepID=A0A0C3I9G1_PISTI|nr:hypothetical protein M404DRAFT_170381 [Pisolithus tinctorius Marx 270]